jgi:hypothetical protein
MEAMLMGMDLAQKTAAEIDRPWDFVYTFVGSSMGSIESNRKLYSTKNCYEKLKQKCYQNSENEIQKLYFILFFIYI